MSVSELIPHLGVVGWICTGFFFLLFLGTVLIHVNHFGLRDFRRDSIIRHLNTLHFLPYWSFFAPNPGIYSYKILTREFYEVDRVGQWHEVPVVQDRFRRIQFLWNPHGCLRKALLDVSNELIETSYELLNEAPDSRNILVQLTIPYIKCLALASKMDVFPASHSIQFAVVQCYRKEDPKILLLSKRHNV